jgi:hypothetical protein
MSKNLEEFITLWNRTNKIIRREKKKAEKEFVYSLRNTGSTQKFSSRREIL